MNCSTVAPYAGVADKETTISLYWGLSAASNALATSNVTAADLSDNTNTCTGVHVLSTGYLDTTVGTYCTGTRTVSAVCSADGAGACANGGIMHVTKLYQQIGATSAPMTATYATAPYFILSGWNGKPMFACQSSVSDTMAATITSVAPPFTLGVSFAQTANFTGYGVYFGDSTATLVQNASAANLVGGSANGGIADVTATATNATGTSDFTLSHAHRVAFSVNSAGTKQSIYVDGAAPVSSTTSYGSGNFGSSIAICVENSSTPVGYADALMSAVYIDPIDGATSASTAIENATGVSLP